MREALAVETASESDHKTVVLSELAEDVELKEQAHRSLRLGSIAVASEVEVGEESVPKDKAQTLQEAIEDAYKGDLKAKEIVRINARTDVIERTQKAGHVTRPIKLHRDSENEIHQYGYKMKRVIINAWHHATDQPEMKPRVIAENNNVFRLHNEIVKGNLEDACFVEMSLAADNMSKAAMDQVGFFTDTMTCMIRITYMQDGEIYMQNAMLAGVKKPGGERHDRRGIAAIAQEQGIDLDFENMSSTETLDTPFLVRQDGRTPEQVLLGLVKQYDKGAGTFFGEDKPQGDYEQVVIDSAKLEEDFECKVESITNDLINHATFINSPKDASRLLNKVSAKYMLEQAVVDRRIDAMVFGGPAAADLELARMYHQQGNNKLATEAANRALKKETSSSCPGGVSKKYGLEIDDLGNVVKVLEEPEKLNGDGDGDGPFEFNCPKCKHKNDRRKEADGWVYNCQSCRTDVSCGRKKPTAARRVAEKKRPNIAAESVLARVISLEEKRRHKQAKAQKVAPAVVRMELW